MAITFRTWDANGLWNYFNDTIADGHVRTWLKDSAGDFEHNTGQWSGKAYFRPSIKDGSFVLSLVFYGSFSGDKRACFSELHGAMIYSSLQYCHVKFWDCTASTDPVGDDSSLT